MTLPRNQLGISLLEIIIALTASAAATGVAVTLYVQSNADAAAAEARQKMQVLYMELDRAYPAGIYTNASISDIEATLAPDHILRSNARFGIGPTSPVTLAPGSVNNGLVDTAVLQVGFDTTRTCVGIVESTFSFPFDASVSGVAAVVEGQPTSVDAIADACEDGSGVVEIIVRASESA